MKLSGWLRQSLSKQIIGFGFALVAVTVLLPLALELSRRDSLVASWGAWIGALVVGVAGLAVIPQLALLKASTETDVFLKVCGIVDDPGFDQSYKVVSNSADPLKAASFSEDGKSLAGVGAITPGLPESVRRVLNDLEKVGIIFYYATNKEMIADYIGDDVIGAHEALEHVIGCERSRLEDGTMYERFSGMYDYCKKAWNAGTGAQA
jgi:hypothetical protein